MTGQIPLEVVADVLHEMHTQLGEFDAEARAVVGVRVESEDEATLEDVELSDEGILSVGSDIDAIVVMTGDELELSQTGDLVSIRQLVAILRDGREVGVFKIEEDPNLYVWTTESEDPNMPALRPRDLSTNTARRAFGLDAYAHDISLTEVLARLWLLHVGQVALELFDQGVDPVSPEQLEDRMDAGPFEELADAADLEDQTDAVVAFADAKDWEDLRQLAAKEGLALGPYELTAGHASWLDAPTFAQHLDETIMTAEELLASLDLMGGDDLVHWALQELGRRGWLADGEQ